MFRSFGPLEIGLLLVVVLAVFGVGKLPQVSGVIGKGLREFRSARSGTEEEVSTGKAARKLENKIETLETP